MNFKNYFLLFFLSITISAFGQYQHPFQVYEEDGKFGLKDATKEILVKPIYLDIKTSAFGIFAMQSENRKWAIFDQEGVRVTGFIYDRMEQRLPSVIEVRQGAKVGLVSEKGKVLVPIEYEKIIPIGKVILAERTAINNRMKPKAFIYKGAIVTNNGQSGLVDEEGKIVIEVAYDRVKSTTSHQLSLGVVEVVGLILMKDKKYGIVDKKGQTVFPMEYDYINATNKLNFGEIRKGGKKGMYNSKLKVVVKPQFDDIKLLNENIFAGKNKEIWTIFNIENQAKVYAKVDEIYPFKNGYTKIKKGKKVGIMDKNGAVKVSCEYDAAIPFGRNVLLTKAKKNFIYTSNGKTKPWAYSMEISWQDLSIQLKPIQTANGKYGYINDDGRLMIKGVYDVAKDFRKGVAIVGKNGKYGFVDEKAQFILPLEYELVDYEYEPSVLLAKKEGQYGYLNYQGKILIEFEYEALSNYESIIRAKKDGKWGWIDKSEKSIIPFEYDFIENYSTEKTRFRYQKGAVLGWIENDINTVAKNIEEWADEINSVGISTYSVKVGKYYGLVGKNKEWIIPVRYETKITFNQYDKAIVRENNNWGMIERNGKTVIPTIYHDKFAFGANDLACVRKNGLYGVVNADGKVLISPIYENFIYTNYEYWTVKKEGKFGITNSDGHLIIPIEYENVFPYVNHVALAKKNGKWGCINELNQEVIPFEYQVLNSFKDNKAIAKKGDYWGMINRQNEVIVPFKYNNLIEESGGFINANKAGFWGIMNENATVIVPFEYHRITMITDYFKIEKNEKIGIYTKDGEMILPAFYDALTIDDNGFKVKIDKKSGLLAFDGSVIIPAIYDELMYFSGGYSRVKKGNEYGMISESGLLNVPCEYDALGLRFRGNFIEARKGEKWGIINKKGKMIVSFKYEKIHWINNTTAEGLMDGKWIAIEL